MLHDACEREFIAVKAFISRNAFVNIIFKSIFIAQKTYLSVSDVFTCCQVGDVRHIASL